MSSLVMLDPGTVVGTYLPGSQFAMIVSDHH
jgi:hypothetical protein